MAAGVVALLPRGFSYSSSAGAGRVSFRSWAPASRATRAIRVAIGATSRGVSTARGHVGRPAIGSASISAAQACILIAITSGASSPRPGPNRGPT